jgi:hypothetical protein
MKKLLPFLLLLLLSKSNFASHVAGAELTYQCLGSGNYKFTYTLYRDCYGISAPYSINMNISNGLNFSDVLTLDTVSYAQIVLPPPCPGIVSVCNGGTYRGIEKYVYEGYYSLPGNSSQWNFSVIISPRAGLTTSQTSSGLYSLFVEAKLNNSNDSCFDSPVFNSNPEIYVCANQPYCIDLSASASNVDSLSYSIIPPKTDANTSLIYDSGYSFSYPFMLNSPFYIDNQGKICFTPLQPDQTCYAVLVSSYKDGTIISQVERDIVIFATTCGNYQPEVSGINGSTNSDTSICAYSPFCFNIYSSDLNSSDSTSLQWNNEIPSASFTIVNSQNDISSFCWTPGLADIDSLPHCFTVNVKDNSCPSYQTNSRKFCIHVYDLDSGNCNIPNSIDLLKDENYFSIYPQPSNSKITIDLGSSVSGEKKIVITDILNNKLVQINTKEQLTQYELPDIFHSGIYLIYATDRVGRIIKRGKLVVGF